MFTELIGKTDAGAELFFICLKTSEQRSIDVDKEGGGVNENSKLPMPVYDVCAGSGLGRGCG